MASSTTPGPSGLNVNTGRSSTAAVAMTNATAAANANAQTDAPSALSKKKKKNRGGRRRRNRRQSFAASSVATDGTEPILSNPSSANTAVAEGSRAGTGAVPSSLLQQGQTLQQHQHPHHHHQHPPPPLEADDMHLHQPAHSDFYQLGKRATQSSESLESEVLLDHREQQRSLANRRPSLYSSQAARSGHLQHSRSSPSGANRPLLPSSRSQKRQSNPFDEQIGTGGRNDYDDEDDEAVDDRTPLISRPPQRPSSKKGGGYGGLSGSHGSSRHPSRPRRGSASTGASLSRLRQRQTSTLSLDHDVNNPPSVPASPLLGSVDDDDDEALQFQGSPVLSRARDAIINIDHDAEILNSVDDVGKDPYSSNIRRHTMQEGMEDVCVPFDQLTDIVEEDMFSKQGDGADPKRRRHKRRWPDLAALDEWAQEEQEELKAEDGVKAKKVSEPVLVGGRLRPRKGDWQREEEEAPFRWTYFNEELDSSLKSHSLSGLQQLGMTFKELFIPDRPVIEYESSSDEEEEEEDTAPSFIKSLSRTATPVNNGPGKAPTRQPSIIDVLRSSTLHHDKSPDEPMPSREREDFPENEKPKAFGPRPVFWLDVLAPTYEEMRIISRAFGIHKLTAEDIMEQEAREKVELFRNYYFVNYRTFEQDEKSDDYLDAVNMYFVVFKGGVISFHFSQMPHPPNVRRRIRQLTEHQYTDSDWISYAIIDNITDAYAPLIEQIEKEVDEIDDEILRLNSPKTGEDEKSNRQPQSSPTGQQGKGARSLLQEKLFNDSNNREDQPSSRDTGRDMLLRVGECRKRVMSLYRLLGNKADVIKGLAKRCNEQWQVAPRSDVGLYLGDIQDHIITMTGNLTHYENILSRAHSNYLAQINIGMNERAEQTADVLGKLTVLGTIVLPMNIVTGMWGMNCIVPGQEENNLYWFFGITAFLILFGVSSFFVAKKVYKIV